MSFLLPVVEVLGVAGSSGDVQESRELVKVEREVLSTGQVLNLIGESSLGVSFTALGNQRGSKDEQASLGHFNG